MVESDQLLCVVTVVETVRNSGRLRGGVVVHDLHVGCPSIIDDANLPEAILGVTTPLEDDFAIYHYFTAGSIKEYLTASIAEECN
jgi:hypothetical protein